jgi:hypothetical protein
MEFVQARNKALCGAAVDFWLNQKTDKLEVDNVKIHKVPVQEDGVWTQVLRYNFDGMDIEETNLKELRSSGHSR